jgi:hypothetical protein
MVQPRMLAPSRMNAVQPRIPGALPVRRAQVPGATVSTNMMQ